MHTNSAAIFITVWCIAAGTLVMFLFIRGKNALSIFPELNSVIVKYRYKFASGRFKGVPLLKAGAASSCLDIVVTDTELWLKSMVLFAGVSSFFNLVQRIPLNRITNVEKRGSEVNINFSTDENSNNHLVVVTKNTDEFLRALKK